MKAGLDSLENVSRLLRRAWVWARRAVFIALLVVTGVLLLEWVHLHELLARVHPWLARIVSGLLASGVVGFAGWTAWRWWRVPRVIVPPELPSALESWSADDLKTYRRFVRRYLERQQQNLALEQSSRQKVPAVLEKVDRLGVEAHAPRVVAELEAEIDRLLEPLDRKARQEVWQSASQVAVITAVNPSALLDVLITLLRNLELMARLAKLYYGRPGIWGSARIAHDVLAVAATAGVVDRLAESVSEVAGEMFGSWTARLAGPVGQGLTNGLLTVRLGDAAVLRCRSLRSRRVGIKPWSPVMWREMARRLSAMVGEQLAPDMARAFTQASRSAGQRGAEKVRQAFDKLRGARGAETAADDTASADGPR
ncbi:MAG: DUF697 domain-containing protein [Acidobacteriota bacterium]|nr:MAG: DUF697 domain-containing protein [Acidobacteriota bacterium]